MKKIKPAVIPGKYEISVAYRFDGEENFTLHSRKIFMLPWPFVLVSGLIIGLFIFFCAGLNKKYKSKLCFLWKKICPGK